MYKPDEHLFKTFFETDWAYLSILLSTIFFSYSGMLTSSAYTLPLFAPLGVYIPLLYAVKLGMFIRGIKYLCFWAVILAISIFVFSFSKPRTAGTTIIKSKPFTNSKFLWIKNSITENHEENNNYKYIKNSMQQGFLVVIAAIVSGGYIALMLISMDIAKMAFYVSQLFTVTGHQLDVFIIGWEIWNVFKIISFIYFTMSLSSIFLYYIMDFQLEKINMFKYFLIGIFFFLASFTVRKVMLNPTHRMLHRLGHYFTVDMLPQSGETTDFKFY